MKLLFCGTPEFARVTLEAICGTFPQAEICVLSAPARRQGRGMTLTEPPVAAFALERGFPLYQPETLKNEAFLPVLEKEQPDRAIVAAYGTLLPPYFISYPRFGCMNVHASLLPKYRGASPIQRAIWDGNEKTGVTIMQMDNGLDTGDILLSRETGITAQDNSATLTDKLAKIGAELICEAIRSATDGTLNPVRQDDALSTYAAKLSREEETLDFSLSAKQLDCQIRALAPRPYANTHLPDGTELKICSARPTENASSSCGTVRIQKGHVFVSCGEGQLELGRVKPQGKGEMDAAALVNGRKLKDGDRLL